MPLPRYLLALLLALLVYATPARAQNPYFFSLDGRYEQTLFELLQIEHMDILCVEPYVKIAGRYGNTHVIYYYNQDSILWRIKIKKNYDIGRFVWPVYRAIKRYMIMAGGTVIFISGDSYQSAARFQEIVTVNQNRVYRFQRNKPDATNIDHLLSCTWVHRAPPSALRDFDFVVLGDLERQSSDNRAESQPKPSQKGRK